MVLGRVIGSWRRECRGVFALGFEGGKALLEVASRAVVKAEENERGSGDLGEGGAVAAASSMAMSGIVVMLGKAGGF